MTSVNFLRSALGAAVICAAALGSSAQADVIYDGGAPELRGGARSDRGSPADLYYLSAMPFTLSPGMTEVTDAHWWGICALDCPAQGDFVITFYQDAAGLPGTEISSYGVGSANQTATGNIVGDPRYTTYPEYEYDATIAALSLAANTPYWVEISNNTEYALTGSWFWETTATTSNLNAFYCGPGTSSMFCEPGQWGLANASLAFQLTGPTIPEPATVALLGIGLAGLGFSRRRKRA